MPSQGPLLSRSAKTRGPLSLAPEEVHLWSIPLTGPAPCSQTLSREEQERKNRLHFPQDRHRFALTYGALREILSRYTPSSPQDHSFLSGPWGKPTLAPPHDDLHFNLSHSEQRALLALQRDVPLGIDLEYRHPPRDLPVLAETILSPTEWAAFQYLPPEDQTRQFFAFWTAKEAALKTLGTGLSIDPKTVEVHFTSPTQGIARVLDHAIKPVFFLQQLDLHPEYAATLATSQPISRLCLYDYHQ